ncbi:lipid-A-disaccharide synthase N-terminal domain-containing protein [Desulfohalobium retbaense]|uniref:Lipid A biosynthesis N-terminal domain-containing protein n=1 Tax=Desulfohalobium retbaense (strain ATCC 49708 / DSM 5692 / JCM 16813 / HR100) TaxID=485915 RepID=C8X4F4_DESRD|nr:lipid-A-disaccharide synthase N-terminal domain-containing protein [Desulfohalobium retbaense]ACV69428.1 conserved hypothetical protein [Desulfohalobium retbaense DSM 5692]
MPSTSEWWLLVLGICGQSVLFGVLFRNWVRRDSTAGVAVAPGWWGLACGAAFLVLIAAWLRRDVVLFAGQSAALFLYAREVVWLRRRDKM